MVPLIPLLTGLSQIVPLAAKWIGGNKSGKAAQKVFDIAKAVVGEDDPNTVLDVIRTDPNKALEFEKALLENDTELERLNYQDIQDARKRDIELRKQGYSNWRADVLAITAILGMISLILILLFVKLEIGPARDVLLLLSGALVAIVKDVYSFEFGSSRGSKEKDIKL